MTDMNQVDYKTFIKLFDERDSCRYTTRLLFTNNYDTYYQLVDFLSKKVKKIIHISDDEFCHPDSLPDISSFDEIIKKTDGDVLITSIGEYLRIGEEFEKANQFFYDLITSPRYSTNRVWIPIFSAKDVFERIVIDIHDERLDKSFYEFVDHPSSKITVTVVSDKFENEPFVQCKGIRQWFRKWDYLNIDEINSVSTRQFKSIKESEGTITIHKINSYYELLIDNCNFPRDISEQLGDSEKWKRLFSDYSKVKSDIKGVIKQTLNMYDINDHKSLVRYLGDEYKIWLIWLWYRLKLSSDNSYFSIVVEKTENSEQLCDSLEYTIVDLLSNKDFERYYRERQALLQEMKPVELTDLFWDRYNDIGSPLEQLKVLTSVTSQERVEVIKIVSKIISFDNRVQIIELVRGTYPDLALYLSRSTVYQNELLADYFDLYKYVKIKGEFDSHLDSSYPLDLSDHYDSRWNVLLHESKPNAYYLCVDGMGIEWLDLILAKLKAITRFSNVSYSITRAVVPTTTKYNMSTVGNYITHKINDLDTMSHLKDGDLCDYPSLMEKQIRFITETLVNYILKNIPNEFGRIVVYADHGLSRAAALAFHNDIKTDTPGDYQYEYYGRFAIIPDEIIPEKNAHAMYDERNNALVMRDHYHFKISGNIPGETHGGATPEELLVPVIVLDLKNYSSHTKLKEYGFKIKNAQIMPEDGKKSLELSTDQKVNSVSIIVNGDEIVLKTKDSINWSVDLYNLEEGKDYLISIVINGIMAGSKQQISVLRPGIEIDDDF